MAEPVLVDFVPGAGLKTTAWICTILAVLICAGSFAFGMMMARSGFYILWFNIGLTLFIFAGLFHIGAAIVRAIHTRPAA